MGNPGFMASNYIVKPRIYFRHYTDFFKNYVFWYCYTRCTHRQRFYLAIITY